MRNRSRTVATTLAGLFVAVPAMAGPLPGFVLKAETAHFAFYARPDGKVDARRSERYLAEVETALGHAFSGRAEYYRYGSAQELAAVTGTYASGVTFSQSREIHSTEEFHAHEIVHLVAGQLGDPGAFFQEGLAVALGNRGRWRGKAVDDLARSAARRLDLPRLLARFESVEADLAYPVAGSFVSSLLRKHGASRVADFFRACGPSGADRDAAFLGTFGESLEEATTSWLATL